LANTIGKTLPPYIQQLRKIGFSSPWADYIKTIPYFRDKLFNLEHADIFKTGILNKIDLKKMRAEFIQFGQHQPLIIQLVFISIWYESYFKRLNG
jgi:hypothetical protein